MSKKGTKKSSGFALFVTLFLVILFSFYSLSIVQNNIFLSNLVKLKYFNFQAKLHMDKIKSYINTHSDNEIEDFKIKDKRFNLDLIKKDEDNKTIYYIYLKALEDTPIRLSDKIIK